MTKIHQLNNKTKMSPIEALAMASREEWSDIIIIGYQNDEFVIKSSAMTRKDALWLAKQAELNILDILDL